MKLSLLIITPRFPYPVVGGDRLRIYQLCRTLSKKYRLTLLSLCDSKAEMNMPLPDDHVFDRVERVYLPKWRSWLNCIIALFGRQPLQVAYYRNKEFHRRANEIIHEHDGTLSHLIRVGDAIKNAKGVKFLEMTDAISLNYNRIRDSGRGSNDFRAQVYAIEAKRTNVYEKEIVDHFDHTFLVSEVDRQYLFSGTPEKLQRVSVFSNGVALDEMPYQFDKFGKDIIFIGNMLSLQNLDAAKYMAEEVLPRIRRAHPETRLRLIGRIKPEQADLLAKFDGVDVTGEVSSVAVAARGGAVGVCPLRLGAGVQNKVLEYMALGLPVVTTSIGLEGFNAKDGNELLVADGPDGLANHVIRLLDDRVYASIMSESARRYVESHHSWDAMLAPMVQVIHKHLTAAYGPN